MCASNHDMTVGAIGFRWQQLQVRRKLWRMFWEFCSPMAVRRRQAEMMRDLMSLTDRVDKLDRLPGPHDDGPHDHTGEVPASRVSGPLAER
jgi:hypothetical protein